MEYILIVSFALLVGFVLGVLTISILGAPGGEEALRREPVPVRDRRVIRR